MIDSIVTNNDNYSAQFITDEANNANICNIILEDLNKRSFEQLEKLPDTLLRLIVSKFENQIDLYNNNLPILKVIAQSGSISGTMKLESIIAAKLNDGSQITEGLELINSLKCCT